VLTSPQLAEWLDYFCREPFGFPSEDLNTARIMAVIANALGGGVSPLEFLIGPKLREAMGDVEPANLGEQIAAALAGTPGSRPPATHWSHFCGNVADERIVDLPFAVRRCEVCGVELPPAPPDPSAAAPAPTPELGALERTQVGSPLGPNDEAASSVAAPGRNASETSTG
jgi:hypothetical protein